MDLHFITFVCKGGRLYELDGRRAGAVDHGPCSPESLLASSCSVIRRFMEVTGSIQFSMMAMTGPQDE